MLDKEDPVFEYCPANQTVTTEPCKPTRLIQWESHATDSSGDSLTVTCDPATPSNFTIGQTSVTCIALDAYGNSNSCIFYVDVKGNCPLTRFDQKVLRSTSSLVTILL